MLKIANNGFFWRKRVSILNLKNKFSKIKNHWQPKIIAQMNGSDLRVVKVEGEFIWHSHNDTDELFFVHKGQLIMNYRDKSVIISEGEIHIVLKGVEHKPESMKECEILIIEMSGTKNTGEEGGAWTAPNDEWI